jgi:3-hydroxyisobutyrate dehydrogenase-like beta-hydroxyacid dehydrogenase
VSKKVGFIGLGTMGMPMAKNLLKKYGYLLVSDLVAEKTAALQKEGAEIAKDNIQVAEQSDIIFVSLLMPKIVETVVAGEDGLFEHGKPGQYIIDTSTVSYGQSFRLSELAAEKGITYIDIPISGGAGRASDGTLSLIAGATKKEMEEAELVPYLEVLGNKIHYADKRGGGVGLKILNNMLSKSILFADAEAILLAEHMGIPFETLCDVISSSSSQNEILRIKQEHIAHHDYGPSNKSYFPVTGTLKDLNLAKQLGEDVGVSNFNCNNIIQWYRIAEQHGYGDWDSSSIVELLRELEPVSKKLKIVDINSRYQQ